MINSNWHPISYHFGVVAAYCINFAPTRSLWLKISSTRGRLPPIIFARIVRLMNALQRCPWQFSHRCYGWGATSEHRAKIDDFAPTRSLWSKISGTRGCPPPIMPYNFASDSFHTKKLCSRLSSSEIRFFNANRTFCVFQTPFGALRGNVRRSSESIGKRVVDFLLASLNFFR